MLGQGHKIILTMSRWPNRPNMCGAKYVVPMRYQVCGAQMCGARISHVVPKYVVPLEPLEPAGARISPKIRGFPEV